MIFLLQTGSPRDPALGPGTPGISTNKFPFASRDFQQAFVRDFRPSGLPGPTIQAMAQAGRPHRPIFPPYKPIFPSRTAFWRPFRPIFPPKTTFRRPYSQIFRSRTPFRRPYRPIFPSRIPFWRPSRPIRPSRTTLWRLYRPIFVRT